MTILFSHELLEEIKSTVEKPKLKKYFSASALEEMLLTLEAFLEIIPIKSQVDVCRDPKDNFLLELSKDGKADFLLIGDKDLLEIRKYGKTQILTITDFLEENSKSKRTQRKLP